MKALMIALMTYASTLTGLPVPDVLPTIEYRSDQELFHMAHPGQPYEKDKPFNPVALYLEGTAYLRDDFDVTSDKDVVVLTHELVHHMQFMAQVRWECIADLERGAYDVTLKQVKQMGTTTEDLMGLGGLVIMFVTAPCGTWDGTKFYGMEP